MSGIGFPTSELNCLLIEAPCKLPPAELFTVAVLLDVSREVLKRKYTRTATANKIMATEIIDVLSFLFFLFIPVNPAEIMEFLTGFIFFVLSDKYIRYIGDYSDK